MAIHIFNFANKIVVVGKYALELLFNLHVVIYGWCRHNFIIHIAELPLGLALLAVSTLRSILLTFLNYRAPSTGNTGSLVRLPLRAHLTRYLKITLHFEAWCVVIHECLLQFSNFVFKTLDMLKVFILLRHFVAKLVVHSSLLLMQ